jgi:DNA-binding NtrC family response regulator
VAEAPLVQKAIIRALGLRGIAARPVGSPEQGLELLRKSTESFPMLVVGGVPMTDLRALVRTYHENNPSGEVVFCADDETELDADEGPITTLLKPFTLPELLQVVEARLAEVAPTSRQDPCASPTGRPRD